MDDSTNTNIEPSGSARITMVLPDPVSEINIQTTFEHRSHGGRARVHQTEDEDEPGRHERSSVSVQTEESASASALCFLCE